MIRYNNPGNLRYNPLNNWQGQTGATDDGFCKFSSLYYGLRAMWIVVLNDINSDRPTMRALIYEYAPPNENNTEGYIDSLVNMTQIPPDRNLVGRDNDLINIVYCMVKIETGQYIQMEDVIQVYDDILQGANTTPVASKSSLLIPVAVVAGILAYNS